MNPIFTIEEEKMSEELTKFHLKGMPFGAVLHRFTGPDKDFPHDHPYDFTSFILKGSYIEKRYTILPNRIWTYTIFHRKEGDCFHVKADTIHEIINLPDGDCWTIIVPEKKQKEPGFYQFREQILHRFLNESEFRPL